MSDVPRPDLEAIQKRQRNWSNPFEGPGTVELIDADIPDLLTYIRDLERRLSEALAARRLLAESLQPCLAILQCKAILPPMHPGVQERMAEQVRAALAGENP